MNPERNPFPIGVEYVWLGGNNEFRSKVRIMNFDDNNVTPKQLLERGTFPEWNYDGSSTGQATGDKSEVVLRPCACFRYPLIGGVFFKLKYIVLCETYTPAGEALPNNHRPWAKKIFDKYTEQIPWYGIEQEYFLIDPKTSKPLGWPEEAENACQGQYYCSVGADNAFGRDTALKHLSICLDGEIKLSGINAEVAPGQWEFQVGPCVGIDAGDHLLVARYFMEVMAEMNGQVVSWHPKPEKGDWNGSGCHTNFSTQNMRNKKDANGKTGLDYITDAIENLKLKHDEHMSVYGEGNEDRMSGEHETAKYDEFSWGVGNRGCSVRVGNDTYNNKCGYFEDRRPASNMNPYLVTAKLLETTMMKSDEK